MSDTATTTAPDAQANNHKGVTVEEIRQRILTLFVVYPIISPSMLGIGLGPATVSAPEWRPVLQALIDEGVVSRWDEIHERATGDSRPWTKLALKTTHNAYIENVLVPEQDG